MRKRMEHGRHLRFILIEEGHRVQGTANVKPWQAHIAVACR